MTMTGISFNFSNTTHNDSCVNGVTETIMWSNKNMKSTKGEPIVFACTTARICYDIGHRPVILFQKGNEMHGTCVNRGSSKTRGMVLITKRGTVQGKQRYMKGKITDLRVSSSFNPKASRELLKDEVEAKWKKK